MALHLVTGYAGAAHVTAEDDGSFNSNIFGTGNYVLNRGNKFSAQVINNNTIRINDGDALFQGRFLRLVENTYEDLSIDNGSTGFNRNDLIVIRYTKNVDDGKESASFVVIKGTPSTGTAEDPEYNDEDILDDHALIADMPLYRVPISGLTVGTLVPMFVYGSAVMDGSVTWAKIAPNEITPDRIGAARVTDGRVDPSQSNSLINTQTGSYTLTSSDAGKLVLINSSESSVITIPVNLLSVGSEIEVLQYGSGSVSFVAAEGVTILSSDGLLNISGRYSCVCLKKLATNTWLLCGALS